MLNSIQKNELKKICNSILFDISIAPYTTFKVGGRVWALCNISDMDTLIKFVKYLYKNDLPYIILGNGSNVLISDSGFKGIVIKLKGFFNKIKKIAKDNKKIILDVGAGTSISHVLRYCMNFGIGGIEFLAGIPGTIGGAVAMNAGAFEKEIGNNIEKITMITSCGDTLSKNKSELEFLYRRTKINPKYIITNIWLRLYPSNKDAVKKKILSYLDIRYKSQPLSHPSAGCIFKNPSGHYAGKLIDEVGLKGKTIGGAMISKKHANFIINTGNAKAKDIMALIKLIMNKIKEEKGIELEPEINIIGFS